MKKQKKIQFKIHVYPSVKRRIVASARKHGTSINREAVVLIMSGLDADKSVYLKPGIYMVS